MTKIPKPPSALEEAFALHVKAHKLPEPMREFKFDLLRKWRFDFAWPEFKIAVECEGGVWTKGRHQQPQGFIDDCTKYNAAVILGWSVLRFTEEDIKSGAAVLMTRNLILQRMPK